MGQNTTSSTARSASRGPKTSRTASQMATRGGEPEHEGRHHRGRGQAQPGDLGQTPDRRREGGEERPPASVALVDEPVRVAVLGDLHVPVAVEDGAERLHDAHLRVEDGHDDRHDEHDRSGGGEVARRSEERLAADRQTHRRRGRTWSRTCGTIRDPAGVAHPRRCGRLHQVGLRGHGPLTTGPGARRRAASIGRGRTATSRAAGSIGSPSGHEREPATSAARRGSSRQGTDRSGVGAWARRTRFPSRGSRIDCTVDRWGLRVLAMASGRRFVGELGSCALVVVRHLERVTIGVLLRVTIGVFVGISLFLIGGLVWQPPVPACPGCAVLAPGLHCPGGGQAVQGGQNCRLWVADSLTR